MTDTYTYTARNTDNPDLVMTFTLDNDHVRLNLPETLDQLSRVSQAEDKLHELRQQIPTQIGPGAAKVFENVIGPLHVTDAAATLHDRSLRFWAWQRIGGLRLAPLVLNMGQVDNPDAAEAFVDELEERKSHAPQPGKFAGPLDYWFGWAGLLFLLAFLIRWPIRKVRS